MSARDCTTILLVEDEAIILMVETRQLQDAGYTVLQAHNGEDAVRLVCDQQAPVDLVLMDIDLGSGIDGTMAAQKILEARDLPVLFLSSHTEKEIVERTENISSYGYVVKNSSFTVLDASIKMALRLFDANRKLQMQALVLDQISDHVTVANLDGQITYINQAQVNTLGRKREEIIGNSTDVYGEDATNSVTQQFLRERTLQDGGWRGEVVNFAADGRRVIMDCRTQLIYNLEGKPVAMAGIATDITKQVEAANELKWRDTCLKAIIENQPGMLWLKDSDGVILAANKKFALDHGFAQAGDVQGKTDYELVERPLAEKYARIDNEVMAGGVSAVLEESYVADDGTTRSIEVLISPVSDDDGRCIGTTGYARDVTERVMMRKNYEDFFNTIDDMLFVADLQGHILKANVAAIDRLGYSNDELSGLDYYELLEEKYRTEAGQAVKAQIEGRLTHWQHPVLTRDGVPIPVETRIRSGNWNGQPVYLTMCKDISQLMLSEEKFSKLFQINPFICGLTRLEDNIYTEVNDEFINQLGYSREEVIGKNPVQLGVILEDDFPALLAQARPDGSYHDARAVLYRKDGQARTMLLSAGDIRVGNERYRYTVARDITPVQKSDDIRYHESDFLRTIVAHAAEGICVCHAIDEYPYVRFTVWNSRMTDITGYSMEEINRMGWYQTVYPDPEVQQKAVARMATMRVGDDICGEEWEITCADATRKKLLISTSIVMHDNGIVHVLGLMHDITARSRAEAETKSLLREKEIVLRETHHRVKNNMAMMHNLFVLQQMHETDERVRLALEDAANRVKNMTFLYDQIFSGSQKTKTSLAEFLQKLVRGFLDTFPSAAKIQAECRIDDVELEYRTVQTLSIIINELLCNSLKHAFNDNVEGCISLEARVRDGLLTIIYYDNGIGLPLNVSLEQSPGIGLKLVAMLAESINCRISHVSEKGGYFEMELNV